MIKTLIPFPLFLAAIAVMTTFIGFSGCRNQTSNDALSTKSNASAERAATATLILPPTATPAAMPTLSPTPTARPLVPDETLPCSVHLTSASWYPYFLHWIPGGSNLIFKVTSRLYSASSDGAQIRQLVNANPSEQHWTDLYADVSPDGSQIVYTSCAGIKEHSKREAWEVSYEISVMNTDGTGHRRLTSSRQFERLPVWSPVGDRIAYLSSSRSDWPFDFDLRIMDKDGSDPRRVIGFRDGVIVEPYPPVWSPDGRRIAFITSEFVEGSHPKYFLNTIASDGSDHTIISETMSIAAWSPKGGRIALLRSTNGKKALFTIEPDGSDPHLIANTGEIYPKGSDLFDLLAWSPDGGFILHPCSPAYATILCVSDVIDAESEEDSVFIDFDANNSAAAWSPDGSRIAIIFPVISNHQPSIP